MPDDLSLMIAIPTMGEMKIQTVKSLFLLTQDLARREIPCTLGTYEFSDIVISRNYLLSAFYSNTRFTHILMLDSDMAFEPAAIFRLLGFGADFSAIAYPQKKFRWTELIRRIELEADRAPDMKTPVDMVLSQSWLYNHQIHEFGGGTWTAKQRDGFITVPAAGTGLMLLSRRVPEEMVTRGLAKAMPRMDKVETAGTVRFHDFFSHLESEDGEYLYAEDQSFCYRWTKGCEGQIWLDTRSRVTHVGTMQFSGRYADQLVDMTRNVDRPPDERD